MNNAMEKMTLEALVRVTGGVYHGDPALLKEHITGAVIDSRKVEEGNLFVAIPGERVDGHSFAADVLKNGALCVLSERELENVDGPYIQVESTLVGFNQIARAFRQELTIPVIGVTGSVGKTSTKEMVASVLGAKYNVLKTIGNFNNELGLPLTLFRIRLEHEIAVLEMGIDHFKDMERLAKMAIPNAMIITNVGTAHLEFLGDRDGILRAKTECFDYMQDESFVVLNGDDDKLITQKMVNGNRPIFYGMTDTSYDGDANDIYASDIENLGFEGMKVTINTPLGSFRAHIHIPGEHNVMNALAATAVGLKMGLSLDEISKGIDNARTIQGRTNLIHAHDMIIVDDCYNASPLSMKASLKMLSSAFGRTIAVLGDMGELGTDELMQHREVGISVSENKIDVLFAAGTLAREYVDGALSVNPAQEIHYFEDTLSLLSELKAYVKAGDSILIKASHFMGFDDIVKEMTE